MTQYTVHLIKMNDSEDPDLYVAEPIWDWQQTDAGKWVMKNSVPSPKWHRNFDANTYGFTYTIRAELTAEQITFFELKFK